jgi:4-amino-4-deoxy-L-arabinose transferase-like glycosyltransferase
LVIRHFHWLFAALGRAASRTWFCPVVIASLAWGTILVALDPAGDHPGLFVGPGLTVDEAFNAGQGVALVDRLLAGKLSEFREIDATLPDHPPLGRLWIGLCHELAWVLSPPVNPQAMYSITCARTASATAFAILVVVVGLYAGRWYGRWGGAAASLALVLMPRLYGHAHLAALETMVNLTCTATVLFLADAWGSPDFTDRQRRYAWLRWTNTKWFRATATATMGGLLFGLALLTKVQAVLLPIPIVLWTLSQKRWRAIPLLTVWGVTACVLFFACWPYLWSAPFEHLKEYLGRTTTRAVLYVWYFGQVIADRDVPWHYPWVMFLVTVPIGLLALGIWGVWGAERRPRIAPREALVLGGVFFPLFVFSFPGVAVYDGERLFSLVFPLWGVLVGRGAESLWRWLLTRWSPRTAGLALAAFFAGQSVGLVLLAPCWLSYYNLVVGGLPGAAKLGLEVSYWGDGVTRTLLAQVAERVPAGDSVAVLPELWPGQWSQVRQQSPILRAREITLVPFDSEKPKNQRYVLMFMRPEYLPEEFRRPKEQGVVAAIRRQGVPLAVLVDRQPP